jgi:hypothetical protein
MISSSCTYLQHSIKKLSYWQDWTRESGNGSTFQRLNLGHCLTTRFKQEQQKYDYIFFLLADIFFLFF